MAKPQNDENGILTLSLGDGSTLISTLTGEDYAGLVFSQTSGSVGEYHLEAEGLMDYELNEPFFKIVTASIGSLQVLIDRAREAQDIIRSLENHGDD